MLTINYDVIIDVENESSLRNLRKITRDQVKLAIFSLNLFSLLKVQHWLWTEQRQFKLAENKCPKRK